MDIYEMKKKGMTQEEIFNMFKAETAAADMRLAHEEKEKAAAEAAEAKSALLNEARAHLVNAIVAYSEAFAPDMKIEDEDIQELEAMLKDSEAEIEAMFHMAQSAANLLDTISGKSKSKENQSFKVAANLDPDAMDKLIRGFLRGLQ